MERTKEPWVIQSCSMAKAVIVTRDMVITLTFARPLPLETCEAYTLLTASAPKLLEICKVMIAQSQEVGSIALGDLECAKQVVGEAEQIKT